MSNMEENSTKEAKADDVGDSAEAKITKKVPPSYGSKAYWDQRYKKLLVADNDDNRNDDDDGSPAAETIKGSTIDKEANKHDSNNDNNDDDPVAFHSWYFTYDDLKPMILPLILGGKEEVQRRLGGTDDDDIHINNNNNNNVVSVTESSPQPLKAVSKTGEQDSSAEDKADNSEEDDDGWEEVEGDESDDSEEEEQGISQMEAGLVIEGPVAVLEVGCGDVPLVLGLADDLGKMMEAPTSKPTQPIVNRIVCTDYSDTLIHTLERIHQKKRKLPGTSEAGDSGTASTIKTTEENPSVETNKLAIEYMVADARDLPFAGKSFHLILEKGTMDAMISDDEVGESNCIGIVSDCARVLATGGCFFLVSHINVHTSKGEEWLQDVVITGLRQGGSDASWNIEVHGNTHGGSNTENDDDSGDPPEAAGPAVYLMFKGERSAETKDSSEQPAITLQFFYY